MTEPLGNNWWRSDRRASGASLSSGMLSCQLVIKNPFVVIQQKKKKKASDAQQSSRATLLKPSSESDPDPMGKEGAA